MAVSLESVCYLCLNKMHRLKEQGEGKRTYMTWIKIPFNILRKMFLNYFMQFCLKSKTRDVSGGFSVDFQWTPLTCLLPLLVVSYRFAKRGHLVSGSVGRLTHERIIKSVYQVSVCVHAHTSEKPLVCLCLCIHFLCTCCTVCPQTHTMSVLCKHWHWLWLLTIT